MNAARRRVEGCRSPPGRAFIRDWEECPGCDVSGACSPCPFWFRLQRRAQTGGSGPDTAFASEWAIISTSLDLRHAFVLTRWQSRALSDLAQLADTLRLRVVFYGERHPPGFTCSNVNYARLVTRCHCLSFDSRADFQGIVDDTCTPHRETTIIDKGGRGTFVPPTAALLFAGNQLRVREAPAGRQLRGPMGTPFSIGYTLERTGSPRVNVEPGILGINQ